MNSKTESMSSGGLVIYNIPLQDYVTFTYPDGFKVSKKVERYTVLDLRLNVEKKWTGWLGASWGG